MTSLLRTRDLLIPFNLRTWTDVAKVVDDDHRPPGLKNQIYFVNRSFTKIFVVKIYAIVESYFSSLRRVEISTRRQLFRTGIFFVHFRTATFSLFTNIQIYIYIYNPHYVPYERQVGRYVCSNEDAEEKGGGRKQEGKKNEII